MCPVRKSPGTPKALTAVVLTAAALAAVTAAPAVAAPDAAQAAVRPSRAVSVTTTKDVSLATAPSKATTVLTTTLAATWVVASDATVFKYTGSGFVRCELVDPSGILDYSVVFPGNPLPTAAVENKKRYSAKRPVPGATDFLTSRSAVAASPTCTDAYPSWNCDQTVRLVDSSVWRLARRPRPGSAGDLGERRPPPYRVVHVVLWARESHPAD